MIPADEIEMIQFNLQNFQYFWDKSFQPLSVFHLLQVNKKIVTSKKGMLGI